MLNEQILQYIHVNRDAIAVNRGFYYQFLQVLKKWIQHYVNGNDDQIYTEVGDDIKEVGGKLVFTQIKSYTASFSLRSKALQSTLFNFYTLYLSSVLEGNNDLLFNFQTNAAISPKEKLLQLWFAGQTRLDGPLLNDCVTETRKIIGATLKKKRDDLLSAAGLPTEKRNDIKNAFAAIKAQLDQEDFTIFIQKIKWEFLNKEPALAVEALYQEILGMLQHPMFGGKPVHLLMEVFLSEIYRCSQLAEAKYRMVDRFLMRTILERKTTELNTYFNRQFLDLLDIRFTFVYQSLQTLQTEVSDIKNQLLTMHTTAVVPKQLTLLPYVNKTQTIKRTDELFDLHTSLIEDGHVGLSGAGGLGKSVLAKVYVQEYLEYYDHVVWLDCDAGFVHALLFNSNLLNNLHLSLAKDDNTENLVNQFLTSLSQLPGKNLLVLDDFNEEEFLPEIQCTQNGHLLLTTRKRFSSVSIHPIAEWNFEHAKKIYRIHEPKQPVEDATFLEFFKYVDYNPLAISLCAKTVHNSIDLNLIGLSEMFQKQKLDSGELEIDIKVEGQGNTRLMQVLRQTYDLSAISRDESFLMKLLSVLPKEIRISDMIDWYGKDNAKENKTHFNNYFNSLHDNGWLLRDGDNIYMHGMVQEAILYKQRAEQTFIGFMFQINWMAHRLREGIVNDFGQSLRFLRYGESILKKIREEDRSGIYQPMLVLENEVLNVYTWISGETHLLERTQDLLNRAIPYLGENDGLVGVMYNNLGMSYVGKGQYRNAESYLLKSAELLQRNPNHVESQYLYTLCNLSLLYVQLGNYEKFKEWFDKGTAFRNQKKLYDDPSFPFQVGMLGFAMQGIGNEIEAIRLFQLAIKTHRQLSPEKQNDLSLILYLNNLAFSYVLIGRADKAQESLQEAVERLGRIAIRHNNKLIHILIQTITGVMGKVRDRGQLDALLQKLEAMKTEGVEGLN